MSDRSVIGLDSALTLALGGDLEAWRRLCAQAAPMLHAYLGARIQRPAVVERLVSQTFISAWRHLSTVDRDDCGGWLRRLAAGTATSWAKEHPLEAVTAPFPPTLCPQPDQHRRMEQLQRALTELDETHVRALELRYRAGLSDDAIARILRIVPTTVSTLLTSALEELDRADSALGSIP